MNMHFVSNIDKELYNNMINYLGKHCDKFSLVEPHADSDGFPDKLPPTKEKLSQFLLERKRVSSWAGTQRFIFKDSEKAVEHIYKCCNISVKPLLIFDSFFDIDTEYDIDISFYKDGKCVLFAVAHEEMLLVDLDFWGSFFVGKKCKLESTNAF